MARTKQYDRQIYNQVKNINRRLLDIEKKIGINSEQYKRYVNTITAAVPSESYKMDTLTGKIRLKNTQAARDRMKVGNLRATLKNPTAGESIRQVKAQIAKTKKARGERPTVSDEQALREMAAKQKIQDWENEHGKLKYDDSVKEEMQAKGAKTYEELADIIGRGEDNARKRERRREYYAKNKDRINKRRRERNAARRKS